MTIFYNPRPEPVIANADGFAFAGHEETDLRVVDDVTNERVAAGLLVRRTDPTKTPRGNAATTEEN